MHPNVAAIESALGQAQVPGVKDFLRFMRAIHPADRLPSRAAFDPTCIAKLLPNIVMVEVVRANESSGMRFFVRVVGQAVADSTESFSMNRYLDETLSMPANLPGNSTPIEVRRRVVETGQTYFWSGPPRLKFKLDFYGAVEYAHCPLAEDGVAVDRIVSIFTYGDEPKKAAASARRPGAQ